jgi:hypothetical protein
MATHFFIFYTKTPFHNLLNKCVIPGKSNTTKSIGSLRECRYSEEPDLKNNCYLFGWEISHFLLHVMIGYYFNVYVSVFISVGYEIYEHYTCKCASVLDIVYNLLGYYLGNRLRLLV